MDRTPPPVPLTAPSSPGEIIAPAGVFAGPTGVWRGVRNGMGAAYVSRSGGGSAGVL